MITLILLSVLILIVLVLIISIINGLIKNQKEIYNLLKQIKKQDSGVELCDSSKTVIDQLIK